MGAASKIYAKSRKFYSTFCIDFGAGIRATPSIFRFFLATESEHPTIATPIPMTMTITATNAIDVTMQVRVVQFEYDQECPWAVYPLEAVVDFLDSLGYDCYFVGTNR